MHPSLSGAPHSGQNEKEGYEFCGKCGRRLNPQAYGQSGPTPNKMGPLAAMPFVLLLLILCVCALIYGIAPTFDFLKDYTDTVLMLLPALEAVGTISGPALQAYWIFQAAVILVSAVIVILQSKALFKPRKDGDTSAAEKTPFYWICLLFTATFVFELIIMAISTIISGQGMELPDGLQDMPLEEAFYSMANAAFWEEIISRMLPIGIPMVILAACHGKKDFLKNILGGFGTSRLAWILIFASSIMFGYAHVTGWGWMKFLPTFLGGLAMGYLYVRFGIHASIIFHFITDYLGVLAMLGDVMTMIVGGLIVLFLIVGLMCIITLFPRIGQGLRNLDKLPVTGFEPGCNRKE